MAEKPFVACRRRRQWLANLALLDGEIGYAAFRLKSTSIDATFKTIKLMECINYLHQISQKLHKIFFAKRALSSRLSSLQARAATLTIVVFSVGAPVHMLSIKP